MGRRAEMETKEKWLKYTQYSTFHGLDRAFNQEHNIGRRMIWLLMILGTFVFMVYTISLGVSKLLHPEYVTQISVKRESSIAFPSVTFCPNNMFRKSYVESNPDVLAYTMLTAGNDAKWLTENKTLMAFARSVSLKDINQDKLTQKLIMASSPMSKTIFSTSGFNGKFPSNKLDWFTPELTSMGMCYRFNKTEFVKYPGQVYGLTLISLVNSDDYFYNQGSLGSIGFKLLPHAEKDFPEVQSRGIAVGPQMETFISLQKRVTRLLPETGCVAEGSNRLELYDTYSQSACINECTVKHQVGLCGCKLFFNPGNYTLCLTELEFACLQQVTQNDSLPEMSCNCPPTCVQETFSTKISGLPYPSPYIHDFYNRQGWQKITNNWHRSAFMTIYFETMEVTTVVEQRAYSTEDFFSDVGGLMGLWLGASVITWAELIEVLWDICTKKHLSSQKSLTIKVKPADMVWNISADSATERKIVEMR